MNKGKQILRKTKSLLAKREGLEAEVGICGKRQTVLAEILDRQIQLCDAELNELAPEVENILARVSSTKALNYIIGVYFLYLDLYTTADEYGVTPEAVRSVIDRELKKIETNL